MTTLPFSAFSTDVAACHRLPKRIRHEKILIVDDEPDLQVLTQLILEEGGYHVRCAGSGAEGLAMARSETPDLILLDINLPDLCGFDVCHELKANPATSGIPVLHLSGDHITSEEQALGLNAGADGYIARPVSRYELLARVEAMLRVHRTEVELRKVTEQLQNTSRALEQIMDYSLDAICTLDERGEFVEVSAAAERMWGVPRRELIGHRFLDLVHPADVDKSKAKLQAVMSGEPTRDFENRFLRPDGGVVMLMWSAYWSGADSKMFCVARDVTEGRVTERALQRMGKRLQTTLESMSDAFYLLDRDWCFTYLNPEAERLLQRSRQEILFECVWDVFPPAKESEIYGRFRGAMDSNEPVHFETHYQPFDRWFEVHAFPSEDGLAVYFRDTTERKHSDNLLKESHERFLNVVRATNHAVWDWDLMTGSVWWADGFDNQLRHMTSNVEAMGRFWDENLHPNDRDRVFEGLRVCIDSGESVWSEEYRFRRPDGTYAYLHDRAYIIRDGDGKALRAVGGALDISRRKHAEAMVAEQAALLDKAQEAIVVLDLQDTVLFWNQSAEQLYGVKAADAIGKGLVVSSDAARQQRTEARELVLKNGDWIGELTEQSPDGREIIVEGHWTLVRDEDGAPKSILCINTDITSRKRLEAQALRAQRMESIGTLAGGIAHDLNNVLTPIIMSIDLLKMYVGPEGPLDILETIEGSAHRGAEMVRQVLSFARGVEGERVPIQPRHLLKEIHKIVVETFPKNIDLKIVVKPGLWNVVGDPTQLHQVLLNLCVNARDAMPNGGSITITVGNELFDENYAATNIEANAGPHVVLEVSDTGTGIAPDVLEKIFDPFFTTKQFGQGTGLGLSTSLAIVKSHGGFIRVKSESGRGTTFRLALPAVTDGTESEGSNDVRELLRGDGELILLIEDEAPVRTVAVQTLETYGYRVLPAADGAEAIALYARNQAEISAVITDMMMPVMDGAATIEVLVRMNPDVRIIAASGMLDGTSSKVRHFLPKPYTTEVLLRTLAEALGRTGKHRQER